MAFLDDDEELEDSFPEYQETVCDACGERTFDGVMYCSQYLCDSCYANELNYDD